MKLAINGGPKVRNSLFPNQNTVGEKEIRAAELVLRSGKLTGYQGNWSNAFYGGPAIHNLESAWKRYFNTDYVVAVNSCTSGLIAALGAINLRPGEEVIVTPYSMTCSATAPLAWGGIPVFADIDPDTYCLDPKDVEAKITPKTKAILVVDLFGHPFSKEINEIAERHGLYIIEDAAQALGAVRNNQFAGTLGNIGVHSFNQGKHITCGEGGIMTAKDPSIAHACRLMMNHAEAVNHGISLQKNPAGILLDHLHRFGFNLRLTEIQAAIVTQQLHRYKEFQNKRLANINNLLQLLFEIPCLEMPHVDWNCSHSYYVMPLKYDKGIAKGVHRDRFVEAVRAELAPSKGRESEGVTIGAGYITPIYRMPVFDIQDDLCPNAEHAQSESLIIVHRMFGPNSGPAEMIDIAEAFYKVWSNLEELR